MTQELSARFGSWQIASRRRLVSHTDGLVGNRNALTSSIGAFAVSRGHGGQYACSTLSDWPDASRTVVT